VTPFSQFPLMASFMQNNNNNNNTQRKWFYIKQAQDIKAEMVWPLLYLWLQKERKNFDGYRNFAKSKSRKLESTQGSLVKWR
jgi:hypothetical protein